MIIRVNDIIFLCSERGSPANTYYNTLKNILFNFKDDHLVIKNMNIYKKYIPPPRSNFPYTLSDEPEHKVLQSALLAAIILQ